MNWVTPLNLIRKEQKLVKDSLHHDIFRQSVPIKDVLVEDNIGLEYNLKLKSRLSNLSWYNFNDYKLISSTLTKLEPITNYYLEARADIPELKGFKGLYEG